MYIIEHSQIQTISFSLLSSQRFHAKKIVIVPKKIVYLQYVRTHNWNIPGNIYLKYSWKNLPKESMNMYTETEVSNESIYLNYLWKYLSEVCIPLYTVFTWSIPGKIYLKYPWKYLPEVSLKIFTWSVPGNIYLKYPWQFLPEVSLKIFTWSIPGQIYLHFPGNI